MLNKSPLSYKLPGKEDFLIDLANNNYSVETIYNYGRDLSIFERFIESEKTKFEKMSKKTISLYKGFLRSGKHLEVIQKLREKEVLDKIRKAHAENTDTEPDTDPSLPKAVLSDESIATSTRTQIQTSKTNALSPRSVNRMLSALRSYFRYLIEYDLECPIPLDSIKLIRTEKKDSQVADIEDLIRIIEAPEEFEEDPFIILRNRAMFELLFSTGMRISELVNLNMDQINREGKIFIMGKGKKQRLVYLTDRARGHLNAYVEKRKIDSPALFISTRGRGKYSRKSRITARYVQMKIQKYRQLLGIVIPVTPHGLRHGFATYLAEEGANPAAIQRLLGHESLQTTTRYVHASDKFAEETHKQYHPLAAS